MDWLGLRTEPFQPSKALPLMQHVSIGNIDYRGCWQNDADKLIAARIETVHLDCPRLRTFCLQLQSPYRNPDPYNVLSNDSRALSELRLISQRLDETPGLEHLEIVWTSRKFTTDKERNMVQTRKKSRYYKQ